MMSKVVLITGCTRGMGKKLLESMSTDQRVRCVIGVSRPSDKIEKLKKQFQGNNKVQIYGLDVVDHSAVQELANNLKQQNLVPDILINNAAILGPVKPMWEISPHEFQLTMNTNLMGVFFFMKYFMPFMKEKSGQATIINMSSGWGRDVEKNFSAYCTSKWALEGLSQAAAEDAQATNIAIVALAPGVVETDMLSEAKTGEKGVPLDQWIKTFPDMVFSINKQQSGKPLSWK